MELLISTLLGGAISLLSCIITQKISQNHSEKIWLREKKHLLYANLITELQKIKIPIFINKNDIKLETTSIDVDSLKQNFKSLGNYLDENSGLIYLHIPNDVYKEILKLQNEICEITSTPCFQKIDVTNLKSSKIFATIMHSKNISKNLRELLIKK